MSDLGVVGSQPSHELSSFFNLLRRQAAGFDLRNILHFQQIMDLAERLHLAPEQDGDAIAHVLYVSQQVTAQQHGFFPAP